MLKSDSTLALEAMIDRYVTGGWEVRTVNDVQLRAIVRSGISPSGDHAVGSSDQIAASRSGCRKLWVDSKGQVQETDVPC